MISFYRMQISEPSIYTKLNIREIDFTPENLKLITNVRDTKIRTTKKQKFFQQVCTLRLQSLILYLINFYIPQDFLGTQIRTLLD